MTQTQTQTPFRDLDADGRRKRIAALIRDLAPHRQSERAAELIEDLYARAPEAIADIAVNAVDTYDLIWAELSTWMPGDLDKIRSMTDSLVVRLFGEESRPAEAPMAEPAARTLLSLREEIYEINVANGWFDDERPFDDDIALLHSEVSEMLEAYRDHGIEDVTEDLSARFDDTEKRLPKPEGFGSEAADIVVRALDTARRHNIEIPWRSLRDIPVSEQYEDGLTIGRHVSTLHWLIAKIDYANPDLVPMLAYLTTVCRKLQIDLDFELDRKIAYNRTRGYRHGGKRV